MEQLPKIIETHERNKILLEIIDCLESLIKLLYTESIGIVNPPLAQKIKLLKEKLGQSPQCSINELDHIVSEEPVNCEFINDLPNSPEEIDNIWISLTEEQKLDYLKNGNK